MNYTKDINFFVGNNPHDLVEKYGSPLYVYNENVLRERCKDLKNLSDSKQFYIDYSAKANTNPEILKIIRSEGLIVDAMSPGELMMNKKAGFTSDEILYVCNNVSKEEFKNALQNDVLVSVDSISQLESMAQVMQENPNHKHSKRVMIRINPGKGAGHHEKVVTAGKLTKFGINPEDIDQVIAILEKYDVKLVGINQHIGSLFMDAQAYIDAMQILLDFIPTLPNFKDIEIIDFGGGFGIPYKKYENEPRLDLASLSKLINSTMESFIAKTSYTGKFYIEPGRYVVAESALILGEVYATKENGGNHFIGTDLGFNILARPAMYDSHHDVELYQKNPSSEMMVQTVVGNICESGDILAKNRNLPRAEVGDIVGALDAGAYGFSMTSTYNHRPRPAEVLIEANGNVRLIRRRETLEDLLAYLD